KSLANVVLPDPDSPTIPSVSPSATCTCTPSTAFIQLRSLAAKTPLVTGKYFLSPIPCSIILASCFNGDSRIALRDVTVLDGDGGWIGLQANRLPLGTPRGKGATRRQLRQV